MTTHLLDLQAPVSAIDHIRGDSKARVTIVEYGDFECPMCQAAEPGLRLILANHASDIRLIYRHFPLEDAHPHALMAAEAAEAAAAQGQFWEMHDRLLQPGSRLDRASLAHHAQILGLDMALFEGSLNDEIYRQRVREQKDGALRSHLRATPGFFVNRRVCDVSGGIHLLAERVKAVS